MANINTVALSGNLTRDPELRTLPSGATLCEMGLAVNERYKNGATGEWEDRPNFFDLVVWGKQGENCATYLTKGRPIAITGRLRFESWKAQDGSNRSKVRVVAENVQFLASKQDFDGGAKPAASEYKEEYPDVPIDTDDITPVASAADDGDEIPFAFRFDTFEDRYEHGTYRTPSIL